MDVKVLSKQKSSFEKFRKCVLANMSITNVTNGVMFIPDHWGQRSIYTCNML